MNISALQELERANAAGWGSWRLNAQSLLLETELLPGDPHCVRVAELLDDKDCLYLLLHLSRSSWATPECVGYLAKAADAIRFALRS